MKHLGKITIHVPSKADDTQDMVCKGAHAVAGMVSAKGGASPMVNWVDEKCAIPVPNTEGE